MTSERAIIKLGMTAGAGSSHGKSPFMTRSTRDRE